MPQTRRLLQCILPIIYKEIPQIDNKKNRQHNFLNMPQNLKGTSQMRLHPDGQ